MKKKNLVLLVFMVLQLPLFGQNIKISENLVLTKVSDNVFIHTQKNNNGIVYFNNNEAIVVSTPNSDTETQNLINWVENKAKIVAYVIDRWHPDAMEGLDIVKENKIKTYSTMMTKNIAQEKGLPLTDFTFSTKKRIKVGNKKVICHYLGEAHTSDGMVVWIPSEKILFGGNEIRNLNGWVGNIGDANLQEWSKTAGRIKEHYGTAKIVVPGHGKHGDAALIDYTIKLYDLFQKKSTKSNKSKKIINPLKDKSVLVKFETDTIVNNKRILTNARITIQDKWKLVKIESPQIELKDNEHQINSKIGRVQIYDKEKEFVCLRTDVNFNKLIVFELDETVGLVVVLIEITFVND